MHSVWRKLSFEYFLLNQELLEKFENTIVQDFIQRIERCFQNLKIPIYKFFYRQNTDLPRGRVEKFKCKFALKNCKNLQVSAKFSNELLISLVMNWKSEQKQRNRRIAIKSFNKCNI